MAQRWERIVAPTRGLRVEAIDFASRAPSGRGLPQANDCSELGGGREGGRTAKR